jgi:serine/threonine protein kinase/formylglycine-generating enzyme required for sulfatase activity
MAESAIFATALEKSEGEERDAYLAEACAGDEGLRRRVEALLRAHVEPDELLDGIADARPQRIGRYRVEGLLGEGGFGRVYLAHDMQLRRPVAIKVPHPRLVSKAQDAEAYLTEARIVAALDHPNIVPVFDVGSTDGCPCYIVSKYIQGQTLAERIKENRPSITESVELTAIIAETLHHAHQQGLVHRDIKPGNILLDMNGRPHIADFGVALQEENVGQGSRYVGTPDYMSPEQARGEGHRVDGRSDIFSLGIVFYELLTGRRPFHSSFQAELLDQLTSMDPRPPRQWNDLIPKDLERICMKALSKRSSERYTTAKDLADDLRNSRVQSIQIDSQTLRSQVPPHDPSPAGLTSTPTCSPLITPSSDQQPVKIVPKGLRSFDAQDADFFLELLPGPRDHEGLPDSIRFWKCRIEQVDADNTFSVGLMYGPSGCGKSSLMKAGLIPRLSAHVITVYVEVTADQTENRLLNGLRKRCPASIANLGLKDTLTALRRGQGMPTGKKILIVLDQFEQWLHARREQENTELVQALRQCDGGRVQCLLMVRDDFWLAVSRFLKQIEIPLLESQNSALVDLFDTDHARKVLVAFGRAFGRLPENNNELRKEHEDYLKRALSGLAQDGKVICVRLALFAEMMKGKPWTPVSLKEVGGTEGIGVTFLEETFSSATAPPEHRYHQKAARAVLKALLPESGVNIKGALRSQSELLEASGYINRPKDFADLLRILDSEIRLIRLTDPRGQEDALAVENNIDVKYFQLTHDYLVPSLRDWLTRKQKETRRGRAELLLEDCASAWDARPENRQLPSLWHWYSIQWLTDKKCWTVPQRRMMRQANRYHATRGLLSIALFALLGWGAYETHGRLRAHALEERLLDANTDEVPAIVREMAPYRRWINPLLQSAQGQAERDNDARKHLHTSLALLQVDASQAEYLYRRLLDAQPQEVPIIRDALTPHKKALADRLWNVVEEPEPGKESQRLRAASALASFDTERAQWDKVGGLVANDLVLENPFFLGQWREAFRPVKSRLLPKLSDIFREHQPERTAERNVATNLLADYAADRPDVLADLLMDADPQQFAVIFPKLSGHGELGVSVLIGEIDRKLVPGAQDEAKEVLAKREANAAVALLRMDKPARVWPLLRHQRDPRLRSYLVHRMHAMGADPTGILKRLDEEPDITIRRALLLCLGEFGETGISGDSRKAWLPRFEQIYSTDPDPGIHAAAEWLLRQWKHEAWLNQVNNEWANNRTLRMQRLQLIQDTIAKDQGKKSPHWYVNGQGQTMVVIPGPVEFIMGSPLTEARRRDNELQHRTKIPRNFALAATPVTQAQFLRFMPAFRDFESRYFPSSSCPIGGVIWYEAVAYCNWVSSLEGMAEDQWCYEIKGRKIGLKKNYLSLTGYRLPTEAEMEYATRAGAATSRYFGETEGLLPKYAWYQKNSQEHTWPIGSLKPNDFGLFDMQGNVFTWCQERYKNYKTALDGEAIEDREDELEIVGTHSRVLRGCSFLDLPSFLRSADRGALVPSNRLNIHGCRLARTFPTGLLTTGPATPNRDQN